MDPLPEGEHTISAASERGKQIHAEIMAAAERVAAEYVQPIERPNMFKRFRNRLRRRPQAIKVTIPMQWAPKGPRLDVFFKHPKFVVGKTTEVFREKESHRVVLHVEQENAQVHIDVEDPMELAHELIVALLWREEQRAKDKSATIKEQEGDAPQTEA